MATKKRPKKESAELSPKALKQRAANEFEVGSIKALGLMLRDAERSTTLGELLIRFVGASVLHGRIGLFHGMPSTPAWKSCKRRLARLETELQRQVHTERAWYAPVAWKVD